MPTFSWTEYSFHAPNQPLTEQAWAALRSTTTADHERIIAQMKTEHWAQFWSDNGHLKCFLWIFAGGIVLFNIAEPKSALRTIGGLAAFITSAGFLSALITCATYANAISRKSRYYRTEFARAAASDSYDAYLRRSSQR